MESITRPAIGAQLIVVLGLFLFAACKPDKPAQATQQPSATVPIQNNTSSRPDLPEGVPETINGMPVIAAEQVAGGIKDFDSEDLKADGRVKAINDRNADITGFAGVNPCDVIKVADLSDWPSDVSNISTQRNNMGNVVLGCIYTFRDGGNLSVYFSDNQSPAGAAESVDLMRNAGGSKVAINDFISPAAFDKATGEFVWSKGQNFITLVIDHPAIKDDKQEWSIKLAKRIAANM